jgi:adenylate kinase
MRHQPNIIVTGTPGVGKTSHCERLVEETGLKHISVNEVAKRKECHDGWDEERRCWIVDEDQVSYITDRRLEMNIAGSRIGG